MRYAWGLMLLTLTGCATVSSSMQYTQGTAAMQRGDFQRAVELLEEAVRLDPNVSRNRNNLAGALFELGRLEDGWPHVRKAVQLDPQNPFASQNCTRYLLTLMDKAGVHVGASRVSVLSALGEPDVSIANGVQTMEMYCSSKLTYKGDRLESIGDLVAQ